MNDIDSPWFCPRCRRWIGYERETCGEGHDRPALPLTWSMAENKHAYEVTRRDRIRAKVRGVVRAVVG